MAGVRWRRKALDDLDGLDQWRESDLGLPPISPAIVMLIEDYFARVDFSQDASGATNGGRRRTYRSSLTLHSGQAK